MTIQKIFEDHHLVLVSEHNQNMQIELVLYKFR